MQEEQNAWAEKSCSTEQDSDTDTQVHHTSGGGRLPETDSDSAKNLEYSESVYSSDEEEPEHAQAGGTPAMYRPGGHREMSTASSIDWKTWLSANISKFEPSPSPAKPPPEAEFARPTMARAFLSGHFSSLRGHVRESAQIHDDHEDNDGNDDVFHAHTPKPAVFPTTTALTQVEPNVMKPSSSPFHRRRSGAKQRLTPPTAASSTKNENALLVENESPVTLRLPPPPPIPPRSKLRPEPLRIVRPSSSLAGLGYPPRPPGSPSVSSVLSSPGLSEAVQRQFGGGFQQRRGSRRGGLLYDQRGGCEGRMRRGIGEVLEEEGGRGDESVAFI
ncbi:hypothetical protein C8A00DRAFT_35898 [Chaetomidium leptoderma]|uniref:Uncharacterized protein n=1 Tax=Chaetomidium leptoderma TaxID=669021 RepID=A0AAN6VHL6_9PEZI|nr:hypothetical protein C8A00DRAFT_35898 [Chaetomidium leptoderma]